MGCDASTRTLNGIRLSVEVLAMKYIRVWTDVDDGRKLSMYGTPIVYRQRQTSPGTGPCRGCARRLSSRHPQSHLRPVAQNLRNAVELTLHRYPVPKLGSPWDEGDSRQTTRRGGMRVGGLPRGSPPNFIQNQRECRNGTSVFEVTMS